MNTASHQNPLNLPKALKPPAGLFVTGSDTGVGKTYVAQLILRHLSTFGYELGAYKPVASGVNQDEISDAQLLWNAIDQRGTLKMVCPQYFSAPLAPPLAARQDGREVDEQLLRSGLNPWKTSSDFIVVEGAGGLLSPVSLNLTNLHLAQEFGFPLVIVVANRLGAVHQSLATLKIAQLYSFEIALLVLCDLSETDARVFIDHKALIESMAGSVLEKQLPPIIRVRFEKEAPSQIPWHELFKDLQHRKQSSEKEIVP